MGSKTKILPFVIKGIEKIYTGGTICDLFAGSASLAGALSEQVPILSNDIQIYSSILSKSYLTDWNNGDITVENISAEASAYHNQYFKDFVRDYQYPKEITSSLFNKIEENSRQLITNDFNHNWHLFTKYYSGTWWSVEQCTWIDSYRKVIEDHRDNPMYSTLLCALMYAAAYNSQGTGHYAQYRDAKTESAFKDILIYRTKNIKDYFERKLNEAISNLRKEPSKLDHHICQKDYIDCLKDIKDSTIYADPPYCFVHYSRFYHALETLVLYDYPEIQEKNGEYVKGRYRTDRHQSPFCIKTKVESAFDEMFAIIKENNCSLALSYSNTGMIPIEELLAIAQKYFPKEQISEETLAYYHMTMGRKADRKREVNEKLILIKSK